MMRMDDSDPDDVKTPFDGPAGMEMRQPKPLPPDPAAEDWVPPVVEPTDSSEDDQDSPGDGLDHDTPTGQPDAPQEPVKRGRGRPRTRPLEEKRVVVPRTMARSEVVRMGVNKDLPPGFKYFPKPPAYFFKPEVDGSDQRKPMEFFAYVKKVSADPELVPRMNFYVYRNWPVMLENCRQVEKTYDVLQYSDLERRYGTGDYHIKLNDGALGKTICMVNVSGIRNEDYPAVLDPLKVDLSDPQNKSWIARQRSKGIKFLGDAGVETINEEENMAEQVATVQALTGSLDKMATKMIDMAEKQSQVQPPPQPTGPSTEQEAVSKGLDIVAKAANMGNEMMQTAINRLTERASDTPDPMLMMDKAFTMAKEFLAVAKPDGQQLIQANDHSQIIEIMKMQQEQQRQFHDTLFSMQQSQINKLEEALAKREQNQAVSMEVARQPKTIIEQINEMKEVKDTMREVLGLGEEGDGKASWLAENGPMLLQGLTVLGSVISTGLYNLAVIKSGQGTPAPPPGPEMVLSQEQQSNLREHGIPVGGQPPAGQQFASQNPQPASTMEGEDMLTQYHRFLHMIQPSLLKAFQEGASGDDYADTMITLGDNAYFGPQLNGQQVYSMVKENGKPAIMALIKTYPEIWNVVKLTPQKWEKFMEDFFAAEEIWARTASEDDSEGINAG